MQAWLFIFGLAVGSFLNVVAVRYNPEKFILNRKILGGRSACPRCGHKLEWFELVPLLSFLFLRGCCRKCHGEISWQYPLVELASALIFVSIPAFLKTSNIQLLTSSLENSTFYFLLSTFYILVFLTLLLITLIDLRLKLIPDEANIFLVILGIAISILALRDPAGNLHYFSGSYSILFGLSANLWLNRLAAILFGVVFYGLLILITGGRGMGMGDLKLTAALGFVFGWPDVMIVTFLAFIIGSIASLPGLIARKQGLKSFLPFGPFIALGALTTFFFAEDLMGFYFDLFRG